MHRTPTPAPVPSPQGTGGQPALVLISLGAGVQSSTLLLLAAEGRLGRVDGAIFADVGWEPAAVYTHLERLEREVAGPAGIPIHRVSTGNIRDDALDPARRFASMPLFIRNPDGTGGMGRRQCTAEYKIKPIKRQVRELLGYPHPTRVPKGVFVEQMVGISLDEIHRAKDSGLAYMRNIHPLVDLGWTRSDCQRYLQSRGFGDTPRSACIGCPFHSNREWRALRDESPAEWADVIAFDAAIRAGNARANANGNPLLGEAFLHRSRVPLDQAPIDHLTRAERAHLNAAEPLWPDTDSADEGFELGCSPWSCRADSADFTRDDFNLSA